MLDKTFLLMSLAGISSKKQLKILDKFGSSEKVWKAFSSTMLLKEFLSEVELKEVEKIYNSDALENFILGLQKIDVSYVTIEDGKYPVQLKEIFDPPTVLYCKGNVDLLNQDGIAIVGSRVCTRYGAEQATFFAKQLSNAGCVIISGLADGIDGFAQRGCLEMNGKTIAVLAGGLNKIYPSSHIGLANEIVQKGGLLVSENIPNSAINKYDFVLRNRIIAGLSLGVFVPEASDKSGALHTVNFANDNGRAIFALPGPVNSTKSSGTNRLIKNLQGCCVTEPNDIISQFSQFSLQKKDKGKAVQLDMNEELVYSVLQNEDMHYDELLRKTQLDTKTLNSLLTRMEIRGLIIKVAGNFYVRKN